MYVLAKLEVLESHAIIGLPSGVAQCPEHAVGRLAGALWIVIAVELLPSCSLQLKRDKRFIGAHISFIAALKSNQVRFVSIARP